MDPLSSGKAVLRSLAQNLTDAGKVLCLHEALLNRIHYLFRCIKELLVGICDRLQ